MSTGLIALLDDVVSLAKIAAASLDDAATQAAKAGAKAAGVVVDDAAVTPRYVVGFAANRELPIVAKIAYGSLKNKLLLLLPAALALSYFAPGLITPLLMLGGAFLCYEGAEKLYEAVVPHAEHHGTGGVLPDMVPCPQQLENEKVSGAIRTDLILSAEIMAITLSTVAAETDSFWTQAAVLALVGVAITVGVYGVVGLIVKADDAGVALAQNPRPAASLFGLRRVGGEPNAADRALGPIVRGIGSGLVHGMPVFLKLLAGIGTAAMLWVGGGIIVHGLEQYGLEAIGHGIHAIAASAHGLPAGAVWEWLLGALGAGIVGLILGAVLIPLVHRVAVPLYTRLKGKKAAAPT